MDPNFRDGVKGLNPTLAIFPTAYSFQRPLQQTHESSLVGT